MRIFAVLLAIICVGLIVISPASSVPAGVKLVSSGDFTDRDGAIHSWKINGAHAMIWDGQAYLPVGGVFYSRYICVDQTDENWQADIKSLELIKGKGITDLLLKAIGPATLTKPEAWQKLLDYLDANGFTYGIDLSDGPRAPLSGYIIEPTRYRLPDITRDSTFTFNIPDATTAFWMLCSAGSGVVLSTGAASVNDGTVQIDLKAHPDQNSVLLLYPEKEFVGGKDAGISDLWSGFDEFRDHLVQFLGGIKFGKGLRFFVDPLSTKMDLVGELSSLIPDSAGFRIEFESYLAKKYLNVGSINSAWGLKNNDIRSFQQAARLIPLWRGTKGVSAFFDRANARRYELDAGMSSFWNDLSSFRDSSAQNYMNAAADLVKRQAANVPVIYRATSHHRVFANSLSRGGFDGLGVDAVGHGIGLITDSAGPAYSLAEESARSMWLIATGTEDDRGLDPPAPGYPSDTSMAADLDYLREIGLKGIFLRAFQMLPEEKNKEHSLVLVPEQLDWLKTFKDKFQAGDRVDYTPFVIYYPVEPVVGASITRLGLGVWWLPSLRTGSPVDFGDTIGAYTMSSQDGVCLWSRSGPTTITFPVIYKQFPAVTYPTDAQNMLTINQKKNTAAFRLDTSPILVTGLDLLLSYPIETSQAAIDKLSSAIARAKSVGTQGGPSAENVKAAQDVLKNGSSRTAYDMASTRAQEILNDLGTYAWIEGETAVAHNFDGIGSASDASAGAYLNLDETAAPPMGNYNAAYYFVVTKETTHQVWIACATPESGASPFSFSIDGGPWQSAPLAPDGGMYTSEFGWYMIGSANLTKGQHLMQIRVDDVGSDKTYRLGIDAIVFSPSEFKPNGIKKP